MRRAAFLRRLGAANERQAIALKAAGHCEFETVVADESQGMGRVCWGHEVLTNGSGGALRSRWLFHRSPAWLGAEVPKR